LTFLAEARRRAGQYEEALTLLDEACAFCAEKKSHYFEPEVRRCRAEVWFDRSNPRRDPDAALRECRLAIAAATASGSAWWNLAVRMTILRHHQASATSDLSELIALVKHFPRTSVEPPLLLEARAALKRELETDERRDTLSR
jgi:hypothetical protein